MKNFALFLVLLCGASGHASAAACSLTHIVVGPPTDIWVCTDTTATTVTLPVNWNQLNNKVEGIGAGAAGTASAGGPVTLTGGGAGEYCAVNNVSDPAGTSEAIQVGSGGTGVQIGVANGTATTFKSTVLVANPGLGSTTVLTGGAGGTGGTGDTCFDGGAGGDNLVNQAAGGGGGGAGGPNGAGKAGAEPNGSLGAGGGGSDGGSSTAGSIGVGSNGGNGGQGTAGTGGGIGFISPNTIATAGTLGGGGGGGGNSLAVGSNLGGTGGTENYWTTGFGPGGGAGSSFFVASAGFSNGTAGGLYGGGGGSPGYQGFGGPTAAGTPGSGANGILVLTSKTPGGGRSLVILP